MITWMEVEGDSSSATTTNIGQVDVEDWKNGRDY